MVSGTTTGVTTTAVVQRRVLGQGTFADLAPVTLPAVNVAIADPTANPNAEAYEYRLKVTTACSKDRYYALATTILLHAAGNQTTGDVTLTWNPYVGTDFASYEILRKVDGANTYEVVTTLQGQTTTTFTGAALGRNGFNQAYRLRVVGPNGGTVAGPTRTRWP